MKKRKLAASILILGMISLLGGCASYKSHTNRADDSAQGPAHNEMAEADTEMTAKTVEAETGLTSLAGSNFSSSKSGQNSVQKLIKDVYLQAETKNLDDLLENINKKTEEFSGYIQTSEVSGNRYNYESSRYANLVIRIPSENLNQFVAVVDENSNITNKSESTRDVTLEYLDTSSHIAALRAEQESLMEILKAAKNLDDIIKVQSQLTQVRYEIESYESQLRNYDNLVTYSTINLDISEVNRETQAVPETFKEQVSARLSGNLYNIGQGFRNFAIWFISSLPYLAIWAAGIIFVFFVLRRGIRKYHKNKKTSFPKESKTIEEEKKDLDSDI